jgi:hypothetical protein
MTPQTPIDRLRAFAAAVGAGDQDQSHALVPTADDFLALLREAAPEDYVQIVDAVRRVRPPAPLDGERDAWRDLALAVSALHCHENDDGVAAIQARADDAFNRLRALGVEVVAIDGKLISDRGVPVPVAAEPPKDDVDRMVRFLFDAGVQLARERGDRPNTWDEAMSDPGLRAFLYAMARAALDFKPQPLISAEVADGLAGLAIQHLQRLVTAPFLVTLTKGEDGLWTAEVTMPGFPAVEILATARGQTSERADRLARVVTFQCLAHELEQLRATDPDFPEIETLFTRRIA